MQRKISFLLILIATISVAHNTAAQQIKVVSSVDNSPLPFATVTNHSHPLLVSADQDGVAHITGSIGDTLSVSYVGYNTAVLFLTGDKIQIIHLLLDQKLLPAITIHNCRKTKEFNYNNFRAVKKLKTSNETQNNFRGVIWIKGTNSSSRIAVRLNPMKANATLKDFSFWLEKEREAPDSSVLTPLLISLYEVADITNMPGELISNAPIFYFPKKSGKQTIRLDTLHVRIPDRGIYVSLQYIMNEAYEWKQFYWHTDSAGIKKIDTFRFRYGGIIRGLRARDFEMVWYNGIRNEWLLLGGPAVPNKGSRDSIKCEATLILCDDD